MSGKPSPVVEMTKLTKRYMDLHLEPKLMKDAKKIFDKVTANHLSYLPRLNNEEINKDFPEDLPNYLLWPAKSLFPVEKKPAIKQEFLAEIEAEEIIEHTPRERRRRPRYTGTYNVESLAATTSKVVADQPAKRKKTNSLSSESSRASTSKPQQSKRRKTVSMSSDSSKASNSKPQSKRQKTVSESSGSSSMNKACSSVTSVAPLKLKITTVGESLRHIPSISSSTSSSDCSPEKDSPLRGFKANGQPSLQKAKTLPSSSSSSSSSSGSSSDSSDEEIKKRKKKESSEHKRPAPKESKLMKVSRRLALSTPKVVNQNPKPFVKEVPKELVNLTDAAATKAPTVTPSKRKTPEKPTIVKPKPKKFEPPKIVDAPKMNPKTNKPITQEALDKQKLKKIPRIPKKENPLQKLGGIFTVENGWEKTEEAAKIVEKPKAASPANIELEAIRTPPMSPIGQQVSSTVSTESKPLPIAQVNANRKPRSPIRAPTNGISFVKAGELETPESGTNKFDRHRDSDDDSSDEEPLENPKPSSSSSSSSSESENEGDRGDSAKAEDVPMKAADEPIKAKNEPKRVEVDSKKAEDEAPKAGDKSPKAESTKTANEDSSSSSSDEERKDESDRENSPKRACASDLEDILLVDDFELDYEDDDDKDLSFEPPKSLAPKSAPKVAPKAVPVVPEEHFTAELDDLKLTLRKEQPARITAPQEDTKSEFDRNTEEIMAKIAPSVDNATRRTLQQFFGNICVDFLEDNCLLPESSCKHFFPDAGMVAQRLDRCALAAVDEGFNVALQFPKLLLTYFGQFAEQFVKKAFMQTQDESRLRRMVMECEKNARTHALYRTIAGALSNVAQMPPYKAARFIINNHTDSPYAREVIIQMIISTGPDLIRNIRYLEGIAATQTVPTALLDKILANCITYQDPALPNLCLNLLMNLQPKQVNELQADSVQKFLNLQLELTSKNEERETKAAHVAVIVAQKPKQRPPPNI